jgi:hypothetical protein
VDDLPLPTNRKFGLTFAGIFAAFGGYLFWRHSAAAPYLLVLSVATLCVALVRAHWLAPLNRAWMRLAYLLHLIVSPVVLGIMYFAVMTPVGMLMRARGRDPMQRAFEPGKSSYWIARDPPGPAPDSLRKQF